MPVYTANRPTDMLGPASFIHRLLSVPRAGYFSVSTSTDRLGADPGDPFSAGLLAPPPCCYPASAFGAWPAGAAGPVPVHLTPADRLYGVVPHSTSAVHPTPSTWISHQLAHASGLQWPSSLGTPPTDDHTCRVPAHPGQSSTPPGTHCQAACTLRGFPTGTTCSLAGHTTTSHTWPPSLHHQGLGCYPSCRAPP